MKKKLHSIAVLILFLFKSSAAHGFILEKCGQYRLQGQIIRGKEKDSFAVVSDSETHSKITFTLELPQDKTSLEWGPHHLGLDAEVLLQLKAPCWYHCHAILLKSEKILDPFESPQSFIQTEQRPLPGTETTCP